MTSTLKLSELIKQTQEALALYGDKEVIARNLDSEKSNKDLEQYCPIDFCSENVADGSAYYVIYFELKKG